MEAGQPIGIAGGDKYSGGPQIRFWVKDKGATRLTNRAAYTSEHPAEIITKEMNKKDAKKWMENHKTS